MQSTLHRTQQSPVRTFRKLLTAAAIAAGAALFCGSMPAGAQSTQSAKASAKDITINIDGRVAQVDPAPILRSGSVYVPLRGVLENLGAKVTYDSAASRIDIEQSGKRYSLKVGDKSAVVDSEIVELPVAPFSIAGRSFVPLRALAELFGYKVGWLGSSRTVVIEDDKPDAAASVDHKKELAAAGHYGITINFHDSSPSDVDMLLDAAQKAGATLVKFRFDWNVLEPDKGADFNWGFYDKIVRNARDRGLTVVGVLGNTAHWATLYPRSPDASTWRNTPPITAELPAWDNYVRRVVGRYKNDVQAWQVWESPNTHYFRSAAKDYRIVVRRAIDQAKKSDPSAIIFAGEPGGVNLGFIDDLRLNGLMPTLSGVALYPVSQWQPGVEANPAEMVLPISTLRKDPFMQGKTFWVNGLSSLSLEPSDLQKPGADKIFRTKDEAVRAALVKEWTPAKQADYLVKAMTLAQAGGSDKVFWGNLRDKNSYELVDPVNSAYGDGLLRRDNTPRPAYDAYANLTKLIGSKPYLGALRNGPEAVVLLFGDDKQTVAVAWALPGVKNYKLALDPAHDPGLPSSVYLNTENGSQLLDATGRRIGGASETVQLTQKPVWITHPSFQVARDLPENSKGDLRLLFKETMPTPGTTLRAVLAPDAQGGTEDGLFWRKYLGFRGSAKEFQTADGETGLTTTFSREILNPGGGLPNIYLDVADNFLYFGRGIPVRVTVVVKRPRETSGPFAPQGGFNIQYDSPSGFKMTPWQVVEGGDGWATYIIDIPNASFANREGFDMMINTWGSKLDLVFHSVTVQKMDTKMVSASTP